MRLIHFAAEPIVEIWPAPPQELNGRGDKPNGLWVSDESGDDGWRSWCESEQFGLERLAVAHEIELFSDATILHLRSAEDIDRFTDLYALDKYRIDWPLVATRQQGIVISPYVYARRLAMHCSWYYGWDCASGCIWDSEAIASFRVVELAPIEAEPS